MNFCEEKIKYSISCVKRNMYQLDLGYRTIDFTFCQLLSFRKKILENTTCEALEAILESDNFILLFVSDKKHLLYFDVPQLLQLKNVVLNIFKSSSIAV